MIIHEKELMTASMWFYIDVRMNEMLEISSWDLMMKEFCKSQGLNYEIVKYYYEGMKKDYFRNEYVNMPMDGGTK